MNASRRILITLTLLVTLAALAVPAFAQDTDTTPTRAITITEERINSSYWVTNPPRRAVSNVHVDLQAGQVVISATFSPRRADPFEGEAVLVPNVENGRLFWTVVSATRDGEPVSDELLAQINNSISSAWRNFIRRQAPRGVITAIDITDDSLTVTLTRRARA